MEEHGYQGWRNYETWLVMLHISNDESLNDQMETIVRDANNVRDAGEAIKDMITEVIDELIGSKQPPLITDIIGATVNSADYEEMAQSIWADVHDADGLPDDEDEAEAEETE